MKPSITDRALAFLRRFRSADEVAEECRRRGVKGLPCESKLCAVAELLKNEFGDSWTVSPAHDDCPGYFRRRYLKPAPLPGPVDNFTFAFDIYRYPDLVR